MKESLTIAFGRFQPPHWDHKHLFDECNGIAAAEGGNAKIYPSVVQDKKKNPLLFEKKIYYLRKMFPYAPISCNEKLRTIFDIVHHIFLKKYYKKINIVVGADRFEEFYNKVGPRLNQFVHDLFLPQVTEICIMKSSHTDSIHSSTLRDLVKLDQYMGFRQLYREFSDLSENDIHNLFYDLHDGMGLQDEE